MSEVMNIKKRLGEVEKQERSCSKYREELMAKCTHTNKSGHLTITSIHGGNGKELVYRCKQCRKIISIKKITEEELKNAIEILDIAADIIKISADASREEDQEIIKRTAKTQYRLRNEFEGYYNAAVKRGNRGAQRGRKEDSQQLWGRPSTIR